MLDAEFHRRLAPLRRTYVASLAMRAECFAKAHARLQAPDCVPDAVADVLYEAHRMRGVAPTFGFPRLGALAEAVECALDPYLQGGAGKQALIEALAALLEELDSVKRV